MKKVLFFITVTASIFIIKDLVYSIYTLWHKNDLLIVAQKQLALEERENKMLKHKLSESEKDSFVENEARNKLFMAKTGEKLVLMSQPLEKPDTAHSIKEAIPSWRQWILLFFPE